MVQVGARAALQRPATDQCTIREKRNEMPNGQRPELPRRLARLAIAHTSSSPHQALRRSTRLCAKRNSGSLRPKEITVALRAFSLPPTPCGGPLALVRTPRDLDSTTMQIFLSLPRLRVVVLKPAPPSHDHSPLRRGRHATAQFHIPNTDSAAHASLQSELCVLLHLSIKPKNSARYAAAGRGSSGVERSGSRVEQHGRRRLARR